jgi:glutamyl-tRNA synthetase
MNVVTRFPPSPTGNLHIGGARTALYSWLHARQQGGRFVLRIEDTDRARSTEEAVQAILDSMKWLELDFDEGPYFQSERLDRYREVIGQLMEGGSAYNCYCSRETLNAMREDQRARGLKPRYDGRCRHRTEAEAGVDPVVRFRNPVDGEVVFDDLIRGSVVVRNEELDDLVIARPDGMPTYNLTVVVDDMDMGITHVIRGDDHINNTPRQLNILDALGVSPPVYAHVPMILGEDGKRMSKRHGATGVMQYRDDGYLPEALLNYLVRLGWSYGDQELFSREELGEYFRISDVNRSASTFNPEKLLWLNHEYIMALDPAELVERAAWHFSNSGIDLVAQDNSVEVLELVRERCKTLVDLVNQARFFFEDVSEYDERALSKHIRSDTPVIIAELADRLRDLNTWSPEMIHGVVQAVADNFEVGFGHVAQPVRIAVAGSAMSPSIDQTLAVLGRKTTLERLNRALPVFTDISRAVDNDV